MANYVLHGVGKPAISIITEEIHSNTVKGISSLTVELNTAVDLASLNTSYGLANYILYSFNTDDEETTGVISSFSETGGDFITVRAWSNGAPVVGKAVRIKDVFLYLPRCQRLTEIWTPDFIYTKLLNGDIVRKKKGFYYSANLDYSGFIEKDNLLLFRQVLRKDRSDMIFYPRIDNPTITYNVDLSPETEIILNQAPHYRGHTSFSISLIGTQRLSEVPFIETETLGGYGDDYGLGYGVGL